MHLQKKINFNPDERHTVVIDSDSNKVYIDGTNANMYFVMYACKKMLDASFATGTTVKFDMDGAHYEITMPLSSSEYGESYLNEYEEFYMIAPCVAYAKNVLGIEFTEITTSNINDIMVSFTNIYGPSIFDHMYEILESPFTYIYGSKIRNVEYNPGIFNIIIYDLDKKEYSIGLSFY